MNNLTISEASKLIGISTGAVRNAILWGWLKIDERNKRNYFVCYDSALAYKRAREDRYIVTRNGHLR